MKEIYPVNFKPKKAHYSPAILDDDGTLYISGQLSVNPENGEIAKTLELQVKQAFKNIDDILKTVNTTKNSIRMCRVYTPDIKNWDEIDEIYANYFGEHKPARVVVPTTSLHFGCLVEIEAIAKIKG